MEPVKQPAAHFFKACREYNGCIKHDKKDHHWEKGVQYVSPLSGARVSTDAVVGIHPNKVPIRINDAHGPVPANHEEREFLDNDTSEPPLVFEAGIPHVIVDPYNDLFCFSSFFSVWNRGETFSGGKAFRHRSPLAGSRRLGLALPPLTRRSKVVQCKNCGEKTNEAQSCPAWVSDAPDYCAVCAGSWVCYFRNLEQVLLVVPELPKAEPGDEVLVYGFGEKEVVEDILQAKGYSDRDTHFPKPFDSDVGDLSLVGVETTESIGDDGALLYFEGNGITLYEARSSDIDDNEQPPRHQPFLETLFREFCASRRCVSQEGGGTFDYEWGLEGFPAYPPPETTKIASGVIEFRVLTHQVHDGKE